MGQATFRFYAELNDLLPLHRRQVPFAHAFDARASIKDMIEALGVPHTEVDLILVNGESVDFAYHVQDGDRISVYPVFESFDITPLLRVRARPLRQPRFVLDVHLGRLASYLRLLGFDTRYSTDCDDVALAALSRDERRTLLTCDRGLLKRRLVTHGYCVRSSDPREQVREVLRRFDLYRLATPFTRCARCNGVLEPVAKESVDHRLPPRISQELDDFRMCSACGQVYWRGSHYDRLQALIARWLQDAQSVDWAG
jgi:uncharacterized protein